MNYLHAAKKATPYTEDYVESRIAVLEHLSINDSIKQHFKRDAQKGRAYHELMLQNELDENINRIARQLGIPDDRKILKRYDYLEMLLK